MSKKSSPSPPAASSSTTSSLPVLSKIPGSYGLPFVGALTDRLNYFYFQGRDEFFKSRTSKYNSTVFRVNMPPGPFISSDPRVIVLLDSSSFSILFDNTKVEKRNVLDGTFMPSLSLTGGHRMCAYLDTTENKHEIIKGLIISHLATRYHSFIPLFRSCLSEMFVSLEDKLLMEKENEINGGGGGGIRKVVEFCPLNDTMSFDFVFKLLSDENNNSTNQEFQNIREKGPLMFTKWLFFQLGPLISLGLNKLLIPLEDLLLHTIPLPTFPIKSDYQKLYDAFWASSTTFLDEAEKSGLTRSEACHNLIFIAGFNAFGGMKAWFPALLKWVGCAGPKLHKQLANEIRSAIKSVGGLTLAAIIDYMPLTKSVVYEAMRLDPPVPFQYGRCREDMVIRSHDASFQVKKGEMLFGYQTYATRDERIFDKADEFVADRFVGVEGEKLLKYVYWSNGRETDDPTTGNKQCPGKDLVVLLSRVMLAEFFLRYDTFEVVAGNHLLATTVGFVSVTKCGSVV